MMDLEGANGWRQGDFNTLRRQASLLPHSSRKETDIFKQKLPDNDHSSPRNTFGLK